MEEKFYRIYDVKDIVTGDSRRQGRDAKKVGKTFKLIHGKVGCPMCLQYLDYQNLFVHTTPIQKIGVEQGKIKITTLNSIYYLEVVDDKDH